MSTEVLAKRLRAALADLEWSGTIWTDYRCCLFCSRTVEGMPATKDYPVEPPEEHAPDCEWVKLMRDTESLA